MPRNNESNIQKPFGRPTSPPTSARSTASSINPLKPRFQNASKPEMKCLHSTAETLAFRKRNTSILETNHLRSTKGKNEALCSVHDTL